MFGSIRIWQRFFLIAVLTAIPLAFAAHSEFLETQEKALLNRGKKDGVEYLRSIDMLLEHLSSHRDTAAALMLGDTAQGEKLAEVAAAVDADLAAAEAVEMRQGLDTSDKLHRIRTAWQSLKNELTLNSDDQHDAVIAEVLAFFKHIGDSSRLSVDADPLTRHLASMITRDIPESTAALASLRSDAVRCAQIKPMTQAERANLLKSLGRIDQARLRLEGNLTGAIDRSDSLRDVVPGVIQKSDEVEKAYLYLVENLLQGEPPTVTAQDLNDALTIAIATQLDLLQIALNEMSNVLDARGDGTEQISTYVWYIAASWLVVVLACFLTAQKMSRSIRELAEAAGSLANGTLVSLTPTQSTDEVSQLRNALSDLTIRQRESVLAAENERERLQSEAMERVASSARALEEMTAAVQQLSETASVSASVAEQSRVNAAQGTRAVQDSMDGIMRIRTTVQETARRIKRLGERSQESGEIIQMLDDIADRTRMLALNASIQAGMGGEAARGFTVVAEEVQRLADRSASVNKKINALIRAIQSETVDAAAAMDETTREVVSGSRLASSAGEALLETQAVSNKLADLVLTLAQTAERHAHSPSPGVPPNSAPSPVNLR